MLQDEGYKRNVTFRWLHVILSKAKKLTLFVDKSCSFLSF